MNDENRVTIPEGMTPAEVLRRLYNSSRPQGMGFLHFRPEPMTIEQAADVLKRASAGSYGAVAYFDYLQGRVMKVGIPIDGGRTVDTRLYDRDNGQGAGRRAIEAT